MQSLAAQSDDSRCIFKAGVSPERIEAAENRLQVELPDSLKTLLQESDGVDWQIRFRGEENVLSLIWPLDEILREHLKFWNGYAGKNLQPFESFLLFASEGNGDYFGFGITGGQILNDEVYEWSHEEDSYEKTSASLREHLEVLKRFRSY